MKSKVIDDLYNNYKNNCLPHVVLFETNNIENCFSDILFLAKKMLCNTPECKDKQQCENLIDKNMFFELVIIEPENEIIKKEDVQNLIKNFEIKPEFSDKKIFIIKMVEKMNIFAANSILKFLEEPHNNIFGFLITSNKSNVLPTIKSRCQYHKVLYEDNFYKKNLMTEEEYDLLNIEAEKIIEMIIKENLPKLFLYKKKVIEVVNNKEMLAKLLKLIKNYYYCALFNEENVILKSNKIVELINHNKKTKNIIKIIQLIDKTIRKCHFNINYELMIDNFFIEMVNKYE